MVKRSKNINNVKPNEKYVSTFAYIEKYSLYLLPKCITYNKAVMKNLLVDIIKAPDYFSFYELIHTDTGLNNVPSNLLNVRTLVLSSRVLNYIRHTLGFPITINSGYRSVDVNRTVGGVINSDHILGCAFDIRPSYKNQKRYSDLLHLLEETPLHQFLNECIPYPDKGFVHISIDMPTLFENVLEMVDDKSTRYKILELLMSSSIK